MSIPVPLEGFGGGGGASLNFDVKAYATEEALLAAVPKENTIGVITQTAITSWAFSATEPAEPVAGMVWISTGNGSGVAFNALKKNAIQVYPLSAKQYVDGAWVDVTAMSYQGGEWVQFSDVVTYLFNKGDQCTALTGGWVKSGPPSDGGYSTGSVSIGDVITISCSNTQYAVARTKNKISLADFSTLTFVVDDCILPSKAYGYLLVCDTSSTNIWWADESIIKKSLSNGNTGTFVLDISALTGSYYVCFGVEADENEGRVTVSEVYID